MGIEHSQDVTGQFCSLCVLKELYDECQLQSIVCPNRLYSHLQSEQYLIITNCMMVLQTETYFSIDLLTQWKPNNQEDAHEFMLAMFEKLSCDLKAGVADGLV